MLDSSHQAQWLRKFHRFLPYGLSTALTRLCVCRYFYGLDGRRGRVYPCGLSNRLSSRFFSSFNSTGPLLPTLFASPVIGVAVLDSRLRYRGINQALARMNGVHAVRHIGRRPFDVFGNAATKVECVIDQVVGSGNPISLDVTLQLPQRQRVGRWLESFSPIRDTKGDVTQVVVVVLEVTKRQNLEQSLNHLVSSLLHIRTATKEELQLTRIIDGQNEQTELLTQSVELANQCIKEVQVLCQSPYSEPSVKLHQIEDPDVKVCAPIGVHTRPLAPQERRVLQLIADGKNNKEAGALLGISTRTVECYRARLMQKVKINTFAQLVRFAVRNKIIEA
jgi:DNA-binding NarL/FixJ family response regulator